MPKSAIALAYLLGLLFIVGGFLEFKPHFDMYTYTLDHPSEYCSTDPIITPEGQGACVSTLLDGDRSGIIEGLLVATVFNVPYLLAWIATLVNLARAREMTWLVLVFLLGALGILAYLLAGPSPAQRQSAVAAASSHTSSPVVTSALGILQERYARGEIDAPTFAEMRERLRASERPPAQG
jgi:uncharacterized membrane protein